MIYVDYDLFLHFKQGDDFGQCLERAEGDVVRALLDWSEHFQWCSTQCREIAAKIGAYFDEYPNATKVTAQGDTHTISIEGPEMLMEDLARQGLLNREEFEDEDEDEIPDLSDHQTGVS